MNEPSREGAAFALQRARRILLNAQRPDGSWDTPGDMGPWVTAQVVVALEHVGALSSDDAKEAARWLRGEQRPDGSFSMHPYAREGNLGATACAWAALHVSRLPENEEAIAKARRFITSHGGTDAVVKLMAKGDFAAVYLALAGLLDAKLLPCPNTTALLFPPLVDLLSTRFHAGVFMMAFELEVILRKLRGDWGADGKRRGLLGRLSCLRLEQLLTPFQNQDGSWNDSEVLTVLALPALAAAGQTLHSNMLGRAVRWLHSQKRSDSRGLHWDGFGAEVWSTAFDLRALIASGSAPSEEPLQRALSWLCDAQLQIPMPKVNNRQSGAPLTGGWAFQRGNHSMPDCDDTAVVLSALGIALEHEKAKELPPALQQKLRESVRTGRDWLFGMQNPDGGWSAFVWGLPGKRPGAILKETPEVKLDDPVGMAKLLLSPPAALGDPSTEDLTGRVLHALGHLGFSAGDERVARAVAFLREQQCESGAFWGRWVVNYLSSTAFVLMGLAAVKANLEAEWIRRAIKWVVSRQNADGGWGEDIASYRDEKLAGKGHSTAPLTGLVLQALLDCGEGDSEAVARGVSYLVHHQRPDGSWLNGDYLHVNIPPDTFYAYVEAARFYPTEALGKYTRRLPSVAKSRFTDALLDKLRQQKDPAADAVVRNIFEQGTVTAVNELLGKIFRTDEPIPPGLPELARDYFHATEALPTWADPAKLAVAEQLFTRAGWEIAAALFCSSLPQAYAAAKGARVLTQTQEMTRRTQQRIFETAQFVFDVMDPGGFAKDGRGIRTAQKVRLMHAAIRHLTLSRADKRWDSAAFGQPINQEDLAGTLLTFSIVPLNALPRLGTKASAEEAEAWIHAWNVVGHFLGIDEALMARDVAEAEALMERIRARQWAPSPEGRTLIKPLIQMMKDHFPGTLMDGFPVAMVRHLAGDHCANLLGLPPADWTRVLLEGAASLEVLFDPEGADLPSRLFGRAAHTLMEAVVLAERQGKQAQFRIPTNLAQTIRLRNG